VPQQHGYAEGTVTVRVAWHVLEKHWGLAAPGARSRLACPLSGSKTDIKRYREESPLLTDAVEKVAGHGSARNYRISAP
jgi:hypothetical protein